ncbi:MAG: 3-hydroxyacyl-CoA dehydrogenase/enoyl-CoA hydratase family protein [Rickettsiales bacterium]|nr:3-hydroxyacyl-CoA dehydrogenase/enoyl-CoA hydratase family protein [Rickettsiales bacterium]
MGIEKVAVLGSGVMGSGIAALLANSGVPVLLLDIVPDGAEDRNVLAKTAIDKQNSGKMPGFTHKRNAKLVTAGNLEDDLEQLGECDWIIEVVLEKLEVKHDVYQKIDKVRKAGSIVSSNTSTLPLNQLIEPMPESFRKDFMISHFFNPPRFMPLLEVVKAPEMAQETYDQVKQFADIRLGKGCVECKDTPGFLANRIGVYWLMVALYDAIAMGISVEDADAVMSRPIGVPKTAVFGLFDLIGIDLMPLIAKAMLDSLPESDPFRAIYHEPELITKMIADGYTGRKGKGGFYRLNMEKGKVKEALNLKTGEYDTAQKSKLQSVAAGRLGLAAVLGHDDIGGKYAASVMLKTLHYAASLVPEISDTIYNIDEAMKLGYAWKYGPFELIDRLKWDGVEGTAIFAAKCQEFGLPVPKIIEAAAGRPLYAIVNGAEHFMGLDGEYQQISYPDGYLMLKDAKLASENKPIAKNASAKLWDLGDGIACFELSTKMNTFDPEVFKMIHKSIEIVKSDFKGLVIGTDAERFSLGANLGFFMMAANTASWWAISETIKGGQNAFMALKFSPFPVVASLSHMALGGGCEILLHCDAVQAHIESYPGLVEVGVGIVPGWGGCKEMVLRHQRLAAAVNQAIVSGKKPPALMPGGPMPAVAKAFEYISMAKVAGSAQEAQDMLILNELSGISMNRKRVLADAKSRCLELASDYQTPEPGIFHLPGGAGRDALYMAVENFVKNGKATPHDEVVSRHLAQVLTGGDTDVTEELSEQDMLDLEHDVFMQLVRQEPTLARVQHMLETNKPLRN